MHRPADPGDDPVQGLVDLRGIHPWISLPDRPLNHVIHHMTLWQESEPGSVTQADEPVIVIEKHATSPLIDRPRAIGHHSIEVHCCFSRSQKEVVL